MKNTLYEAMYKEYCKGFSLSEVGIIFGMTRQSVYTGFKRRGYEMRKKKELPYRIFDRKKFTLRNHGYYARTDGDRELMHRYVWMKEKGEIPKGYDIHHKNHDCHDNRIENLELLTKSEHARVYATGNNQYGKFNRKT